MSEFLFLSFFILLSLFLAIKTAPNDRERKYLLIAVVYAWIVLGMLVTVLNSWMPFSGGGDDRHYYHLADFTLTSLSDVFDMTRFKGIMEQPGYPWLLSIIRTLFGHELLIYKWLNLFFLIMLALTWYRIGTRLETPRFGRRMLILVLLLTPLWYYVFFLLKDMTITLLQSLAVLATIELWHGNKLLISTGRFLASSFFLLLFRSALIIQNFAVLVGVLVFRSFSQKMGRRAWFSVFFVVVLIVAIVPIITNPATMALLGITAEHRVIGSTAMLESRSSMHAGSKINSPLFPLVYLFSETSGLNTETWAPLNSSRLRGLLALPWIFLLTPFFLLGIFHIFQPPFAVRLSSGILSRLSQSRLMATPWSAVFLFVASSVAISWVVGDSTRWRIPDMPMVAAIALLGWTYSSAVMRMWVLIGWPLAIIGLFSLYFLSRG